MDYKNTIITPKTDFPMKAGLPTREPGMLSRWEEQNLYEAMLEKNKDLPPFVLHDGPPFSNGDIHMGHALNKTLKDFIVRSHAMMGYYTPYVPGWDNHGLPIETAIIKKSRLVPKREGPKYAGAVCETAGQFAYIYALADTEHVALAAPIISAYCVASVLWSRIFLKEKLSWKHYAMIALVVAGIVILGIYDV